MMNDDRFAVKVDENKGEGSLQAEKMGIMSMLADISGKKQIVVSEQREKFVDPSKKRFDPNLDTETEPAKKKAKVVEAKKKESKAVQDTSRFIQIEANLS